MYTQANICVSFQALADSKFSSESYDDANDLLKKVKNEKSVSAGVTVGIGPTGSPFTANVGLSGSRESAFLNKLSKYNEKVLKHNAHAFRNLRQARITLTALKSTVVIEPLFAHVIGNV